MHPPAPPCAELHLHIEGTLEPDLVITMAQRNGITLPFADVDDLRAAYQFTDLQSFLDLYYANMAALVTREDFADMTRAYLARAALANVRHAEIMFDPQAHLARGVPLAVVVEGISGVLAGSRAQFGISTQLIAAFLRDRPEDEAIGVLDALLEMDAPIVGIGLDSAELGHPPADFVRLFGRAREAGLRRIAHAGEEGPAQYVTDALDLLHAERIDHGIRSIEDPALAARLARDRVPLTVCPLSNVALRAVDSIAEHPLGTMLQAGLRVSIHSDDPAYFGGYLDDNLEAVVEALGITTEQTATMAENSLLASFADPARSTELFEELEQWRRQHGVGRVVE